MGGGFAHKRISVAEGAGLGRCIGSMGILVLVGTYDKFFVQRREAAFSMVA